MPLKHLCQVHVVQLLAMCQFTQLDLMVMWLIKRLSLVIQVRHFQFDMIQLIEQALCQEFCLEYARSQNIQG